MKNNFYDLILKFQDKATLTKEINSLPTDEDIMLFEAKYGVAMPDDLIYYFKSINGSGGEYNDDFFLFNSLSEVETIRGKFQNWSGVPDYSCLADTLQDSDNYFVFCNYEFHLLSYAIHLHKEITQKNEIVGLCGNKHVVVANSFFDFMEMYILAPDSLFI